MPVTMTDSASIDYDVQGEGPPLLLIGGLGFGRWGWFRQLPSFTRHFRTITFDVRNEGELRHGVADLADEVVSLLDHLKVRKAHVLGTSLGGFVAQELAVRRPDLVDRLVLVCTSYGGRGPDRMSLGAAADMLGWGSFSEEGAVRQGLEGATSEAYRAERPEEFEQIVRWRIADSPPAAAFKGRAKAGADFDLSRDVDHINAPTLIIHGSEDRYVPVANAAALAGAIPNARLRVLDGAGHLVFIERFADVNRDVVRFLKAADAKTSETARRAPTEPEGEPQTKPSLVERVWKWVGAWYGFLGRTLRRGGDRGR